MIYSATFRQNTPQLFNEQQMLNFGDSRDFALKNLRVSRILFILRAMNQPLTLKKKIILRFSLDNVSIADRRKVIPEFL